MAVKMYNCGQSAGKTFNNSTGYYLSGFADGEGSFNVSLIKRDEQEETSRERSRTEILQKTNLELLLKESSETIRQAPDVHRDEDIVHAL